MLKKSISLAVLAIALAAAGAASAHGIAPKHGGIVQSVNDVAFELVNKDGKATIYVDDHGTAVPTDGASGTLTVLKGGAKTQVSLEAGGGNALVAKGDAKLVAGSKAVASITFPNKPPVSVRFSVK